MHYKKLIILALFLAFISSCVSQKTLRDHKGSYLENVKLNFDAGDAALKKEEYEKAMGYFQFVRSKYPFSKYAALSDLRIADTKFSQKKWLDAASAYEIFVRLHPRHEEVPYASYRIGLSYFHAVPSDFFVLPPSTSRDQSSTKEALTALDRFLVQFPDSQYINDAQEKQKMLFSYLAQHNLHIADYYKRRGYYEPALARLLNINEEYPSTDEAALALWDAASLLEEKIKDPERALAIYQQIVTEKASSPYAERAQKRIEVLSPSAEEEEQD